MMSLHNHSSLKRLKSNQLGCMESRISTESLVAASRKWIEDCTGCLQVDKSFTEYLQDGIVLCELVQCVAPGIIKKINRIRNPFAWRENISFFLSACCKLGLRESQLFAPEDIIATTSSSFTNLYTTKSGVPGSEKVLRRVALTISGLALELQSQHSYTGPCIQLDQVGGVKTRRPHPLKLSPDNSHCSGSDLEGEEEPPFPSPASISSSVSSTQSPLSSSSKTRRVESVTSLTTETSSTDIQSFAELVLYRNGSNKEYTCISKPLRLTQSFNRVSYSNKARVHRTLSDRSPFTSSSKLPPDLPQESISDIDIPALQNGVGEFGGSRESFEEEYPEYGDFDSTTTPSDASTVIYRELLSSRCSSNLPVLSGEECLQGAGGSYANSPISSRRTVAAAEEEEVVSSPQIQRHLVETPVDSKSGDTLAGDAVAGVAAAGDAIPCVTSSSTDCDLVSQDIDRQHLSPDLQGNDQAEQKSSEDSGLPSEGEEASHSSEELQSDSPAVPDSALCNYRNTEISDATTSTEQVTDIYTSKLNHALSPVENTASSKDGDFRRNSGIFLGESLEPDKDMENYMNYQNGGGPVVDSDTIGMNGVRTRGYASNDSKAAVFPTTATTATSTVDVPHHSLSLASDPESPSSVQAPDGTRNSNDHHQNFDSSSLAALKSKAAASLDLSRVQSDALPHSLHPSMVVCENHELSPPRMMADARSIDTCSTEDLEQLSTGSPRHSGSPLHVEVTRGPARDREFSPGVSSIDEENGGTVLQGVSNAKRPFSAPNRSASAGIIGRVQQVSPGDPSSLSPMPGGPGEEKRREKRRISLDVERQRRIVNIQEGARAALQYSTNRHNTRAGSIPAETEKRADTIPRETRSTSLTHSIMSTSSDNDLTNPGADFLHFRRLSPSNIALPSQHEVSPVHGVPQHESSNSNVSEASSSALNLRHLSIDQTKEASLTQMDEIWRQVEAIGDKPSRFVSPLVSTPIAIGEGMDGDVDTAFSPISGPKDTAMGMEGSKQLGQKDSDVLRESDIVISVLEPVDQSTPLRPTPVEEGVAAAAGDTSFLRPPKSEDQVARLKNRPPSFSNHGIESLLDTLKSLSSNEEDEDLKMLEDMLKSNTFKKAKQAHDVMQMLLHGNPAPALHRILPSTQLMRQHLLHHVEQTDEVEELRSLLRTPHVQATLFCHDKVSSRDLYVPDVHYHPTAHDPVDIILSGSVDNFQVAERGRADGFHQAASRDVPFNRKEGATIVFLERTNRPLGCTIYKQEDCVYIGKLLKGCDAEASDMLREGDELLEVNGVPVMGKRTDEIIRLMSGDVQPGTTLAFTIIPVHDESYDIDYEPKYMRAHFNYDGGLDEEIPCRALGLSFQKGDIMEIVNQDDPEWWQASKVFEENAISLPGLVPSMHLQQQREALIRSYSYANTSPETTHRGLKRIFSRKKKKKIYYQNTTPSNILGVGDEIPTYEQVIRLEPDPSLCRPIVLIGAPGVGRRTLIRKLINSDPTLYHPVVQHTTRLIRPGEVNGHDFHFVTKEEFERDIEQDRFLEHMEIKGHFYGTSFSSVKTIMESGHVPVLDLQPQALKKTRHSGVRPYVVFVGSPRLERLHVTRRIGTEKQKRRLVSSPHHAAAENTQVYTESELQQLVKESNLIENQYGHYFDWIIVNDDLQVAADMLKEVSRRLEAEPQWVPHAWKNY